MKLKENQFFLNLKRSGSLVIFGFCILFFFLFMAIFADFIIPYDPHETLYDDDGMVIRLEPPSFKHPFGTSYYGQDIFSQTVMGTRVSLIVGVISAAITTILGTIIGICSGYFGGFIDDLLMRITDIAYGIPVLGLAIILVTLTGPSIFNIIIVISLLLWRTTARTVRSQVLSLKERPFILSAKAAGASDLRIMFRHILPNVLFISLLYGALGVGDAVLAEASLSFLGLGDPIAISWGQMMYYSFLSGSIRYAWWWVLPPGVCLSLFVMGSYLVGRSYEIMNPKLN